MTGEELLKIHETVLTRSREIMAKKNHDYSKEGALGNFFVAESLQACSAENGIIVRMGDKLSRLVSVLSKGNLVKDEALEDTILDIVNYSVLLIAVIQDKRRKLLTAETPITLDKRVCLCHVPGMFCSTHSVVKAL